MRSVVIPVVAGCLLSGAGYVSTALGDDSAPNPNESDQAPQSEQTLPSPLDLAELELLWRNVKAERSAIDESFRSAKDVDALLHKLALIFEAKQYNRTTYAYSKLIDFFEKKDLAPLIRAYDRTKSVEARIWFAAVSDYCGSKGLLEKLSNEVKTRLKGESQVRAAIAVGFMLSDPSTVPYLIEGLSSNFSFWIDYDVKAAPSAAYLLTDLTNQFIDNYPEGLMNFSCWVMPPPVVPYPVPFLQDFDAKTAIKIQPRWREWWRAHQAKTQKQWILDGIERDVLLFRSTGESHELDDRLVSRLRKFLDVDVEFSSQPHLELKKAWEAAQRQ